jgi:hypothetical protein
MTLTPNNHVERHRQPLRLTMVQVREVRMPPQGEEAIDWLLWTNEPARTRRQILAVVRAYSKPGNGSEKSRTARPRLG